MNELIEQLKYAEMLASEAITLHEIDSACYEIKIAKLRIDNYIIREKEKNNDNGARLRDMRTQKLFPVRIFRKVFGV